MEDEICISVADNGAGMQKEQIDKILSGNTDVESAGGNGVGMVNVIQRLSLFFDQKSRFEILSEGPGMGTEVVITIPMDDKGEAYV